MESMAFEEAIEHQLIRQLLESLRAIPEVQAALDEDPIIRPMVDRGYDARVDVRVSGRRLTLLIEAKKSLYPRDVRQALWQLREMERRVPEEGRQMDIVPMLIAESISPGSKELLQGERVGYFDSGGSLFLPAQGRIPPRRQAATQSPGESGTSAIFRPPSASAARAPHPTCGLGWGQGTC